MNDDAAVGHGEALLDRGLVVGAAVEGGEVAMVGHKLRAAEGLAVGRGRPAGGGIGLLLLGQQCRSPGMGGIEHDHDVGAAVADVADEFTQVDRAERMRRRFLMAGEEEHRPAGEHIQHSLGVVIARIAPRDGLGGPRQVDVDIKGEKCRLAAEIERHQIAALHLAQDVEQGRPQAVAAGGVALELNHLHIVVKPRPEGGGDEVDIILGAFERGSGIGEHGIDADQHRVGSGRPDGAAGIGQRIGRIVDERRRRFPHHRHPAKCLFDGLAVLFQDDLRVDNGPPARRQAKMPPARAASRPIWSIGSVTWQSPLHAT